MGGAASGRQRGWAKTVVFDQDSVERLEGRILLTTFPLTAIPALSSDPGARHTIYLDFVGAPPGTVANESVPATPAYDIDGDTTTFSNQELANISEIWARVAEKFSPFNVNVTTVDPGITNNDEVLRQIIGGDGNWTGTTVGGDTGNGIFEGTSSDCSYVFSENFGGDPQDVAEICAHEEALGLGLYEQEAWNGTTYVGPYNYGNSLIAPILGSSYTAQRGIWWQGPTHSTTAIQDDVAVLTSVLGLRPLTVGQSAAAATPLAVSSNNFTAAGIIESLSQGDYYSLNIPSAGTETFTVNVAPYGPTLHAQLQILDANGSVIVTANNANTLGQSITATLAAGNYYLVVKSYGQYGDLGQYTFTGTLATSQVTPTFTISGPSSINEGASYSLNLSAIDPGHTISSWVINWGDGNVQTVNGNPSSVTHVYASGPANCTISATATDELSTYSARATVAVSVQAANNAPVFTISGSSTVNEQSTYSLNLSASDPGHAVSSWSINWGDGSAAQVVGNVASESHAFASAGNYQITASVTDDVGAYPANSIIVQVNPAPDTTLPTALASLGSVPSNNSFTVAYSDNVAINLATLGNANILITGPNGFSELAALAGTSVTTNAPSITAAYLITPPGGAWTYTADGTYTVSMVANSVTDTSGNPVPAQTLGTFTINITPPALPSKGHHTKSGTLPAKGAATYVSFTLAAPAMTTLQLSTSQPGITLELLDANLNPIAGKSGKKSVSFAQPLKAGIYYVRVTYSGAKATTYQVGLTTKALTAAQRAKLV